MASYSSIEQWAEAGRHVADGHSNYQFVLGAWMAAGESFGKKQAYKEAGRITGIPSGTLKRFAYVYRNTLKLREATAMNPATLTWTHYRELAKMDDDLDAQKQMFTRAVAEKMSVQELTKAIDPPQSFPQGNDSLSRLARYRRVSVQELKDSIIKEYLARPDVVEELAAGAAVWPAAEFVAPDQSEVDEQAAESTRMDAAWAQRSEVVAKMDEADAEFAAPKFFTAPYRATESDHMDAAWAEANRCE